MLQPMTYIDMGVSKNGGTQQPWVFLLKMVIFGCFGGTTIYGNTHMVDLWLFMLFALTLTLVCHLQYSTSMSISWLKCTIPCNTVAHVDGHVSTSCGCPEHLPEECPVKKVLTDVYSCRCSCAQSSRMGNFLRCMVWCILIIPLEWHWLRWDLCRSVDIYWTDIRTILLISWCVHIFITLYVSSSFDCFLFFLISPTLCFHDFPHISKYCS